MSMLIVIIIFICQISVSQPLHRYITLNYFADHHTKMKNNMNIDKSYCWWNGFYNFQLSLHYDNYMNPYFKNCIVCK